MPTPVAAMRDRAAAFHQHLNALVGGPAHSGIQVARAATDDTDKEPKTPTRAELWLYGVVGGWWYGFSSDSVAAALRGLDVDELVVRLDSPGGNAIQGIAIGNLLANHPAHVTVVVDGLAASAASVLALGGDRIVMSPGSQFMIHDAWMFTMGNEAELTSDADWIGRQSRNYAETYAHRAGGTAEEWRERMLADNGRGTWYTAAETVAAGLAHEVANIASTAPPPVEPTPDDMDDDDASARAAWDLDVLVPSAARAAWTGAGRSEPSTPKPPSASAVGSTHTEGGSAVAFSDEQLTTMRASLQLEETADEAAILAAVQAVVDENLEERSQTTPAPAASVPDGHVVIPAARLSDLEAGAKAGLEAAKALRQSECKTLLDDNRAKFLPTSRAAWEAEYERDADAVRKHFAEAPDIIPVSEVGHATEPDGDDAVFASMSDAEVDAYAASLGIPKEALRV